MTSAPRSRRLILVGAIAILGLTACGEAGPSASPTSTDAVTTTVGAHTPAVIVLGGQTGTASAGAPMAESTGVGADMPGDMKMRPVNITYQYDGAPPDLPMTATAWYFPAGVTPTTEQVAALAAALGVDGDVRALPADQGGGWMVGPPDYTGPTVNVGADGMQSWWFGGGATMGSACEGTVAIDTATADTMTADTMTADTVTMEAPPEDPAAASGAVEPVPADSMPVDVPADTVDPLIDVAPTPPCVEMSPPAGVPTKEVALDLAKQFFAKVGMDTSAYEFETYADEWSASVTAYLVLDGIRTSVTANVGFGENAAITWAGGFLGTPVQGDEYPLIGVQGGVDRLNAQSAMWAEPGMLERDAATSDLAVNESEAAPQPPVDSVATQEPVGTAIADTIPTDTIPTDTIPADIPTDMPTDQIPVDQEPLVVTFVDVHASLEQTWAADGTVWLLPGYQFDAADGGWYSVTAVEDQYLQQADPLTDVATIESTGSATPVIAAEGAPASEPAASTDSAPAGTDPTAAGG